MVWSASSVTRWLYYFSTFGPLHQRKCSQIVNKPSKIAQDFENVAKVANFVKSGHTDSKYLPTYKAREILTAISGLQHGLLRTQVLIRPLSFLYQVLGFKLTASFTCLLPQPLNQGSIPPWNVHLHVGKFEVINCQKVPFFLEIFNLVLQPEVWRTSGNVIAAGRKSNTWPML